jgi:hypothetical protein
MRFPVALFLIAAVACSHGNPVNTALQASPENRPEVVAYALQGSYVIVAERAATIAENPSTPASVKRTLVSLHEAASPLVKKLRPAADEYTALKAAAATGSTTPEKIAAALAELNRAIGDAAPAVNQLAGAITANQ